MGRRRSTGARLRPRLPPLRPDHPKPCPPPSPGRRQAGRPDAVSRCRCSRTGRRRRPPRLRRRGRAGRSTGSRVRCSCQRLHCGISWDGSVGRCPGGTAQGPPGPRDSPGRSPPRPPGDRQRVGRGRSIRWMYGWNPGCRACPPSSRSGPVVSDSGLRPHRGPCAVGHRAEHSVGRCYD